MGKVSKKKQSKMIIFSKEKHRKKTTEIEVNLKIEISFYKTLK